MLACSLNDWCIAPSHTRRDCRIGANGVERMKRRHHCSRPSDSLLSLLAGKMYKFKFEKYTIDLDLSSLATVRNLDWDNNNLYLFEYISQQFIVFERMGRGACLKYWLFYDIRFICCKIFASCWYSKPDCHQAIERSRIMDIIIVTMIIHQR